MVGVSSTVVAILERLSDSYGAAFVGWLLPDVLYARFERTISADVGVRFARRFSSLVGDATGVRYFGDSSAVVAYDVMALQVVMDALLSKREQLEQIVVRPWAAALNARSVALPGRFLNMEYVTTAAELDARLAAAGVEPRRSATVVDVGANAAGVADARAAEPTSAATSNGPRGVAYSYVFDLRDFERGVFTAARFAFLSSRPYGTWLCVARDDAQALVLARQAALSEWARPRTRQPEHFTVKFADAAADVPACGEVDEWAESGRARGLLP
jgi:hypothetical protein